MIDTDLQESKWVVELRNDSQTAFAELFNRYKKKLYYFALSYLNDSAEAEEVVQSVFVRLWENRSTLDETMSIKNFIYKSTVNACYNFLKKKAVRNRYLENELVAFNEAENRSYDEIFYKDLKRQIDNIISSLPSQQQQIFQLSRFEGLSHADIADKLNLSIRTVENQIYRALKVIKDNLKVEYFFWFCFLFF
ncbi:MAG: RNA polymerase sigma-70 factor [Bacteroidetes bacterium]|nr:RNA polymerase sigma-70 factor [Bacteroidota bacterium]